MSKQTEALKLALEALENLPEMCGTEEAITAIKEALMSGTDGAQPDFWEGYVPEPDSTCNNTLRAQGKAYPRTCKKCGLGPCVGLAQQALDKKAENARELGLDYEPAQEKDQPVMYTYPSKPEPIPCGKPIGILMKRKGDEHMKLYPLAEQPAQEPMAFDVKCNDCGGNGLDRKDNNYSCATCNGSGFVEKMLYTSPQPAQQQEPVAWVPYLSDRADGVSGHYAIARWNPRGYREVWNLRRHAWGAYSDDVLSLEEADTLLRLIEIPTRKVETPQPAQQKQVACKTLCELCVKRGYRFCANSAQTTPILSPQPAQQEPVAWARNLTDPQPHCVTDLKYMSVADTDSGVQYTPLYTAPQAQRTWVGLNDEEKSDLWCESTGRDCVNEDTHVFADAIEAKLKEKNT